MSRYSLPYGEALGPGRSFCQEGGGATSLRKDPSPFNPVLITVTSLPEHDSDDERYSAVQCGTRAWAGLVHVLTSLGGYMVGIPGSTTRWV